LRSSIVAAGTAALLSALVGILSRVGLGALLLRALLGGLAFGALAYGGLFLARRLLPGLDSAAAGAGGDEGGLGRSVDIVLPGEAPEELVSAEPLEGEPAERAPAAGRHPAKAADEEPAAFARRRRDEPEEVEEIDEAPEELVSLIGPEDQGPGAAVPRSESPSAASVDDLDILPDLDGFSDSFAPAEFQSVEGGGGPAAHSASAGAPRGGGSGSLDPAQLAQAVRTILKRDQKG